MFSQTQVKNTVPLSTRDAGPHRKSGGGPRRVIDSQPVSIFGSRHEIKDEGLVRSVTNLAGPAKGESALSFFVVLNVEKKCQN